MRSVRTQLEWVPVSAALLATGAMALAFGALILPADDSATQTMLSVEHQDERWLVVAAAIYFVASVALTLGLPSVLVLLTGRGRVLGALSGLVLAVGFIGTAGYAMVMVFLRALVVGSIRGPGLQAVAHDTGLAAFLYGWIAAFYAGELLLAIALLRAGSTARWVPVLLILHVLTLPASAVLPAAVVRPSIVLMAVGFAGIAITAATRSSTRSVRGPEHR